eukprot:CCRYP_000442-RD/>CCRYP_000442-RD protein AED:0.47 eAED:0.47 QI:0/-1/0/1/-1/0/1/0/73
MTSPKNSSMAITSPTTSKMAGSTSKSSKAFTDFPNPASWPTNSSKKDSTRPATTNSMPHPDFGATNGDLSCLP